MRFRILKVTIVNFCDLIKNYIANIETKNFNLLKKP